MAERRPARAWLLGLGLASACAEGPDTGALRADSGGAGLDEVVFGDAGPATEGPTYLLDSWAASARFASQDGELVEVRGVPAELRLHFFSALDFPDGPELDELASVSRVCTATLRLAGAQPAPERGVRGRASWTVVTTIDRMPDFSASCGGGDPTPLGTSLPEWFLERSWVLSLGALRPDEAADHAARFRDWDTWSDASLGGQLTHSQPGQPVQTGTGLLVLGSVVDGDELRLDAAGAPVPLSDAAARPLPDASWTAVPVGMIVPVPSPAEDDGAGDDTGAPPPAPAAPRGTP